MHNVHGQSWTVVDYCLEESNNVAAFQFRQQNEMSCKGGTSLYCKVNNYRSRLKILSMIFQWQPWKNHGNLAGESHGLHGALKLILVQVPLTSVCQLDTNKRGLFPIHIHGVMMEQAANISVCIVRMIVVKSIEPFQPNASSDGQLVSGMAQRFPQIQ